MPFTFLRFPPWIHKVLRVSGRLVLFVVLTVLTQVGGLVYLLNRFLYRWLDRWISQPWLRRLSKFGSFAALYLLVSLLLLPALAPAFGRVPLPLRGTHLRPLNVWTCLLNRHYVRPALRTLALDVAAQLAADFPGTTTYYLDANFPLINRFPLLPHLSHHDGKKLDLAFFYQDAETGEIRDGAPAWIGYGIHEDPLPGEFDQSATCAQHGHWQYDLLQSFVPQGNKETYRFDARRTKALVEALVAHPGSGKLFIEPHLKDRLHIHSEKVRFQGCQAVRHDDHVHVQLP